MPHQCTACGRQFGDGSKEMLSGCPDCGGSKFQFMPDGGAPAAEEPPSPPDRGTGTVTETVGHVATKLRDFVGDDPSPGRSRGDGDPSPERSPERSGGDDPAEAPPEDDDAGVAQPAAAPAGAPGGAAEPGDRSPVEDGARDAVEDGAQSSARTEMVSPDELPGDPSSVGSASDDGAGTAAVAADGEPEGRVVDTPATESPDLADLREELNDQFEGIRICEPGQYELNLMELYEREETIIALQENGRYVIEPPESWHGDERA